MYTYIYIYICILYVCMYIYIYVIHKFPEEKMPSIEQSATSESSQALLSLAG